jgi:Fe-S-cluster containining protein
MDLAAIGRPKIGVYSSSCGYLSRFAAKSRISGQRNESVGSTSKSSGRLPVLGSAAVTRVYKRPLEYMQKVFSGASMSSGRRSVIQPTTPEQKHKEDELSAGLLNAEREAVVQIVSQDPTPTGLMHVLNNATGFAETMAVKLRHPRTPTVDCKKGCTWCCYQTVPVTAPEAFAIAEFISSSEDPTKLEVITTKLKDANRSTQSLTPRERTKKHIPCAFLDGGKCSIYQVRPLACSEFTSMDVDECKRAYRVGFKPRGIIHEKARMIAFYAVQQGLLEGLRESLPTFDSGPLELTGAVVVALRHGAAESWLAGDNIFDQTHLVPDHSTVSRSEKGDR